MRFAHLKTHHGFERVRLRGPLAADTFVVVNPCGGEEIEGPEST
jgi:hypothetical protein